MANQLKPASTFVAARVPIVETDTGMATWNFLKILQDWDTKLRNGLNAIGQITQSIPAATVVQGRTEGIGTTIQNLDATGVLLAAGVDFSRAYVNKNTDNIADGAGHPLAGGKAAEIALVTSAPVPEAHKWVDGLVAGVFTKSQPAFTDVSGTASSAQIPVLSLLSGQITEAQLPPQGITITIVTAKLTNVGANGSITFQNGILTAEVPAT
jgi:hypothetical protein